jgi:cholesterol transport system auxiliary component
MTPGFLAGSCALNDRIARRLPPILVGVAIVVVAACSTPARLNYDLSAADGSFAARAARRGQLVVLEPTAILPADSERIVIRTGPDAVAYLTGAQWTDQLPVLVQTRLIETFENAHLLRAVGRPGMVADYNLRTDIRRFEVDVTKAEALVEMSAKLIGSSGRILAGKIFSATASAARDDATTVTRALDAALAEVMREIVTWTAPQI